MNKVAAQRQSRALLPALPELFNGFGSFAGLPAIAGLRPFFDSNLLRLEDETRDDVYLLRAELPGVDPVEDLEVTVYDRRLTIKAERTPLDESNGRSEFSYGTFERTVTLPAAADEDEIQATYDRGILTVSVPLSAAASTAKFVEVIETIPFEDDDEDAESDDDYEDDEVDEHGEDHDDAVTTPDQQEQPVG